MVAEEVAVEIQSVPFSERATETLKKSWEGLYVESDASFFLSWSWIGRWLETYKPDLLILEARRTGRLIGLALFSLSVERRHGFVISNCLRLHQTGRLEQDQIWIEYNDFLVKRGEEKHVRRAFLEALKRDDLHWDELVFSGIDSLQAADLSGESGLQSVIRWRTPCMGVDLEEVRRSGRGYLGCLSPNTRQQIKRSTRLYSEHGKLSVHRPANLSDAIACFDSFGEHHLRKWGRQRGQSGYANPEFLRFHHGLIRTCWEKGEVDIALLKAGDIFLAGFYNFLSRNRVYFYLGVSVDAEDNRLKPGLVGHLFMIEQYLEKGFSFYDFMGGDDRYKKSLGQEHSQIVSVALQRPRVGLCVENVLRSARNLFSRGAQR